MTPTQLSTRRQCWTRQWKRVRTQNTKLQRQKNQWRPVVQNNKTLGTALMRNPKVITGTES